MSVTINGIGFVENGTTIDTSYTLADNRNAINDYKYIINNKNIRKL